MLKTITTETNQKLLSNKEIRDVLHAEGPLKIDEFVYEGESIRDLIVAFGKYSYRNPTKYATTTYDGKKDDVQAVAGKKRSFCDLYRWIIYYRPNATVKTVKKEVAKLILEGEIINSSCPTISRGTLFFNGGHYTKDNQNTNAYKSRLSKFTEFGCNAGQFYEIT